MKLKITTYVLLLIIILIQPVYASPGLLLRGKLVAPVLFCDALEPGAIITRQSPVKVEQGGWVSGNYKAADPDDPTEADYAAYSYRIVGHMKDYFLIQAACESGGTASYDFLYQVDLVRNKLDFRPLFSGGDYDGGILSIKQINNRFYYTVSLPVEDFFQLVNLDITQFSVDDAAKWIHGAFAEEVYVRTLGQQVGDQPLVSIGFSKKLATMASINDIKDSCFRQITSLYTVGDSVVLKPKDFISFGKQVKLCRAMQPWLGSYMSSFLIKYMDYK